MSTIAVFDAKPYDIAYLKPAATPKHSLVFHEFRLMPDTAALAKGADAVCIFVNDLADRACLRLLREAGVRHVALRCAGFNNVDLAAAKELGLTVSRVPAYSPHAVAEHTIALLLTLNRKIHRAHNRVRELNFSLNGLVGFDLYGKTAGILGTGKIGRITAQILRGFGVRVLAYDVFRDEAWAAANGVTYTSMEEILPLADIISLHTPLTPETHHLINAKSLAQTKPGVFLVNTSRGKLIDTPALIHALKAQKLGGVALDVYEEEAGVFYEDLSGQMLADDELSRLLTFPNVLITSHQAFMTQEALTQIAQVTVTNITRLAAGEALLEGTQLA
jgi:D-lactate dehydrogenase